MSEDTKKKLDGKKTHIVCMPVALLPNPVVAGSKKDNCSLCAREIWANPGTLKVRDENKGTELVCLNCLAETITPEELKQKFAGVVQPDGRLTDAAESIKIAEEMLDDKMN